MAEVVGISAGREGKVTESLVRAILERSGRDCEFISLSRKLIRPCTACNECVKENRCTLEDDLQEVLDKCYEAEAIVFGAPNYWDHMNALGQSFWERACYSGRHNSVFPLEGKMGVIAAVAGAGNGKPVVNDIAAYFADARIHTVADISVRGEYGCFTCGHGNSCPVGGFVEVYPLGTAVEPELVPSLTNQYPENPDLPKEERSRLNDARKIGEVLSAVLKMRAKKLEKFARSQSSRVSARKPPSAK
jgi:multimeric flavodoxin WrbA